MECGREKGRIESARLAKRRQQPDYLGFCVCVCKAAKQAHLC